MSDHAIRHADKVSFRDKVIFGFGGIPSYLVNTLMAGTLWLPVFNIGFGLNPATIGFILAALRVWDGLLDPLIGHLSDNTRSQWGRRRPYLIVGGICTGILFPLLWRLNPEWGETAQYAYIVIFGAGLYACFSLWNMPYDSMAMELTPSYDERTRVSAYGAFFGKLISIAGGYTMVFVTGPAFQDPNSGEPDIIRGIQVCSFFIGGLIMIAGCLPGLFVKERYYETEVKKQKKTHFFKGLKETFTTFPLWMLIGILFFNLLGGISIAGIGSYINIFLINDGDIADASVIEFWRNLAMAVSGILAIPFWTWFCEKFDKKTAMYVVLIAAFIGHGLNLVCLNPDYPYLQIIPSVFYSAISSSIWMIAPSMKMDISDYDEHRTGQRREGSLSWVFAWFVNLSVTIAIFLSGIFLNLTGYDVHVETQPQEVLDNMFWAYLMIPAAFWMMSLVFLWFYPLNRKRMAQIRSDLEAQRGVI